MMTLEKAKQYLIDGDYTCVLMKDDDIRSSAQRGVKPLVIWLASGENFKGYYAADKVIGKATAFLYVLLEVNSVYTKVISSPALKVLCDHGIRVEYDTVVKHIANRNGDGICPFELAVWDIDNIEEAYHAIRRKMQEMNIRLNVDI